MCIRNKKNEKWKHMVWSGFDPVKAGPRTIIDQCADHNRQTLYRASNSVLKANYYNRC